MIIPTAKDCKRRFGDRCQYFASAVAFFVITFAALPGSVMSAFGDSKPESGVRNLPLLFDAMGRNSTAVKPSTWSGKAVLQVTFGLDTWPNAYWSAAGAGGYWDWSGNSTLVMDVVNPGKAPVDFAVRVDDDPAADGSVHCQTGTGTIAGGKSGTFFIDLEKSEDTMLVHGMRAGPPISGRAGMTGLSGGGAVNPAHIIGFQVFVHQPAAPVTLNIANPRLMASAPNATRYDGIVDTFGQFTGADWPGKIHGVAELKYRHAAEARANAAFKGGKGLDEYGGWAAGPQLTPPGYFTTAKSGGRWWLVTPSGHLFLSFGIDSMQPWAPTILTGRETMFTGLPAAGSPLAAHYGTLNNVYMGPVKSGKTFDFATANLERVYGPNYMEQWGITALTRLRSWGFNTIGNWSDAGLIAQHKAPYVATLGVNGSHARVPSGSDYWGRMHDPFDPQFAIDTDNALRGEAARIKADPWCVGYFVDNELSWGGGIGPEGGRYGLAYGALSLGEKSPAKQAFVIQLKDKYGTIDKLNAAWGSDIPGWDQLTQPYKASSKPNDAEVADMAHYVLSFARKYFTVVRDCLKKYDPNHLYLGCRFAWRTAEAVQAAGEICDVVSFNIYAPQVDRKQWAFTVKLDKPCIIGEFHFGALDRGMFHPGLVSTPNQAARAAMYQAYIRSVVDNPAFVGAHWFQYADEPLTGRTYDGENYNIGFVTVTDTPYPEMVAAARRAHGEAYARHAVAK